MYLTCYVIYLFKVYSSIVLVYLFFVINTILC